MIPGPGDFQNSRHRDDIDGLRAIAVLLVIAFHMQAGLLPTSASHWIGKHISNTLAFCLAAGPMGGFVGVDIFFVISGFLIGGIILREQSAGTFSIIKFYERRIRRIFPALVAVLLFVSVIGYFALTPPELVNLAKSLLAATFSGANIYFWRNSSYFAEPSLLEPLLHTWSLAVEEQFYLVFPLLLLLLHRFLRNHLKLAIVLLTLSSFVASVIGTHHDPTGTFYLAHTRAWELLLGTLVALGVVRPPTSNRSRNIVASAGLALIAIAAFFYTSATMFPGAAALPPRCDDHRGGHQWKLSGWPSAFCQTCRLPRPYLVFTLSMALALVAHQQIRIFPRCSSFKATVIPYHADRRHFILAIR
jgi:peptidoglycan/LPS O-acetylase OafA/YrhL